MKAIVKTIAIGLVAGCSFLAVPALANTNAGSVHSGSRFSATDKESFSVSVDQVNNTEKIRLHIDKPAGKRLCVSLRSATGDLIYSFFTEKESVDVSRDFDFVGTEEDSYRLEISDGKTKVTKQIKLQRATEVTVTKIAIQ